MTITPQEQLLQNLMGIANSMTKEMQEQVKRVIDALIKSQNSKNKELHTVISKLAALNLETPNSQKLAKKYIATVDEKLNQYSQENQALKQGKLESKHHASTSRKNR